ncbi:hypothetical protein EOL94_04070 [bacterium]|nr:hypothetical protein [bacterium]
MKEAMAIFRIIKFLFKPFIWLVKEFGLHIIYVGFLCCELCSFSLIWWGYYYISKGNTLTESQYNTISTIAITIICVATAAFWIRYMYRQVMRHIKKDPAWNYKKDKEKKNEVNPNIDKALISPFSQGFIFGKKKNYFISKKETLDGHILVVGGAGSGKSSCIAIPTVMSWNRSVFAIDIKGELSQKTEKNYTDKKRKIFNPSLSSSFGYDPFYILANSENIVQDIKEIAISLIPLPVNEKDPFWKQSAQNLLIGCMIYFYEQGNNFIDSIYKIQSKPVQQLIEEISESDNKKAKIFINQFVGMDSKTLSGIFTELSNNIMLFATDSQIQQALSKEQNITPKDLENNTDIFICIEESKLEQWKCLLNLIVNQFLKNFERREEEKATPVLFLLDEFARLGKIETIINGLATLRSKKITIALLVQSLAQLDVIYGKGNRQVIADNCSYKAVLKATDADTQEYFSRLVGTYDKEIKSINQSKDYYAGIGNSKGTSVTQQEKRIIKSQDFAYLDDIVLLTPFGWYRVDKAPYYKNEY